MTEEKHPRSIRSYVLRTSRMTSGQRQAYDELYNLYAIPGEFSKDKIDLVHHFPEAENFVLEIGFGMGDATIELAQKTPQNAYVAVDVHTPGVGRVLGKIEELGLKNLKVIHQDIHLALPRFAPQSLDGIHIFFPDPWPKKRHHKRRLLKTGFFLQMIPLLKKGGYIYIATDWEDYGREILETTERISSLENPFRGYCQAPLPRPLTKFESRGKKEQRPILEIFLRRIK